ncbi:MAG: hypothetical protein WAX69_20915 [Victivallales bacterium]
MAVKVAHNAGMAKEFFGTKKEWLVGKNPNSQTGGEFSGACDVIAKDTKGYYFTNSACVGSGLLDQNRICKRVVPTEAEVKAVLILQEAVSAAAVKV